MASVTPIHTSAHEAEQGAGSDLGLDAEITIECVERFIHQPDHVSLAGSVCLGQTANRVPGPKPIHAFAVSPKPGIGSRVPALIKEIERPLGSVCVDGAYDSEGVHKAVENHTKDRSPRVLPRAIG